MITSTEKTFGNDLHIYQTRYVVDKFFLTEKEQLKIISIGDSPDGVRWVKTGPWRNVNLIPK